MSSTIIIVVVIVILALLVISSYNRLVKLRNNREKAFSDIDVQLKQRHDLIPQLVETVKGYMKHESSVLTDITRARSQALNARTLDDKIAAEASLSSAMQGFNIAVEAYPDLKANQNFNNLQMEISDIENKLAAVRRFFNSATTEFNNATEVFPSNIIAGMFGFKRALLFEVSDVDRAKMEERPEIKF